MGAFVVVSVKPKQPGPVSVVCWAPIVPMGPWFNLPTRWGWLSSQATVQGKPTTAYCVGMMAPDNSTNHLFLLVMLAQKKLSLREFLGWNLKVGAFVVVLDKPKQPGPVSVVCWAPIVPMGPWFKIPTRWGWLSSQATVQGKPFLAYVGVILADNFTNHLFLLSASM